MVFYSPSIATLPLGHWVDGAAPTELSLDKTLALAYFHSSSEYIYLELGLHTPSWLDRTCLEREEGQNPRLGQLHREEVLEEIAGDPESWPLER